MMAQPTTRNKENALNKLLTQYDDLDMWIHNYLPLEDTTEDEKKHLKDVMTRDQALKKMDGERIAKMTSTFPAKLRPELLAPVLDELRQNNPAVPGSGLVSLCDTVALPKDPQHQLPASTPQFLRSRSMSVFTDYPASAGPVLASDTKPDPRYSLWDLSSSPLSAKFQKLFERGPPEKCPVCYRKFSLFVRKVLCEQCERNICGSCAHEFVTNGVGYLCKDCLDITRVLCKTGDWFAQYLVLRPANPLRLELDLDPTHNSMAARRQSRPLEDTINPCDSTLVLAAPPPTSRSRITAAQKEEELAKNPENPQIHRHPAAVDRVKSHYEAENTKRKSMTENEKRKLSRKSMTMPAEIKGQLTRQLTIEEPEQVEEYAQEEKGHKLQKIKTRKYSVRFSRMFSYTSKNEVEASYESRVEITGDLEVSLDYDSVNSRLAVMVFGARNIAAADKKTRTSHPYAKVFLFPDPTNKSQRKLHCKGHTCSPIFNQGVCYSLSPSDMNETTLVVELWHKKKSSGSKTFLGEITVPLRDHKWDDKEKKRIMLEQRSNGQHHAISTDIQPIFRGELRIGLKFCMSENHRLITMMNVGPTNFPGTLEVAIHQAKNLMCSSAGPNVCAFVRVELRGQRLQYESQQTDVYQKSRDPVWNSVVRFADLTQNDLYTAELVLSVWHRPSLTKTPQLLGGVRLGYKTAGSNQRSSLNSGSITEENRLWMDLLERPNTWVDRLLSIGDISY